MVAELIANTHTDTQTQRYTDTHENVIRYFDINALPTSFRGALISNTDKVLLHAIFNFQNNLFDVLPCL